MQETRVPWGSTLVVDLTLGKARTEAFKGGLGLSATCNWCLLAGLPQHLQLVPACRLTATLPSLRAFT